MKKNYYKEVTIPGMYVRTNLSKTTELSVQVVKRGKQYTCSGAGNHGILLRTYKCKSLEDLHTLMEMYSVRGSYQAEHCDYTVPMSFLEKGKNAWYVGMYDFPSFSEGPGIVYDNFISKDRDINRSVYWINIKKKN